MRVALVTENFLPKLDGVTRTLAMLLEHLQRRGDQAIVFGPEGAPRRYAGARVVGARGLPLPFYPELRMLLPDPSFEGRLSRFRPDIVHVADPILLGAAGIVWAQRLGVPVVSSYHTNIAAYCGYFHLGALINPAWRYRRFLHDQCAATLCPSPSTVRELESRGFTRLGLWQRGVDSTLFTPARRSEAWRVKHAGDPRRTIVLYVGRLSYEKNLSALISAYSAAQSENTHLVFVGDGPARPEMEQALAGQSVTFAGYLKGAALAEAYASADVFAFPSVTETFGQVVQEAMASGLPVVGYDAEGVRDQVRPKITGTLAAVGDDAGFTAALQRMIARPEERQAFGQAARQIAEQLTWHSVMEGLTDTYHEVIAQHTAQQAA